MSDWVYQVFPVDPHATFATHSTLPPLSEMTDDVIYDLVDDSI
jgi:hypothetical protein